MARVDLNLGRIERELSTEVAEGITEEARANAPVDTGAYRSSIRNDGNRVVSDVHYAAIVETGSSPHVITGSPYLAFTTNGMTVITKSVDHPGTDSEEVFTKAIQSCLDN